MSLLPLPFEPPRIGAGLFHAKLACLAVFIGKPLSCLPAETGVERPSFEESTLQTVDAE